jgi:hypothetical protein
LSSQSGGAQVRLDSPGPPFREEDRLGRLRPAGPHAHDRQRNQAGADLGAVFRDDERTAFRGIFRLAPLRLEFAVGPPGQIAGVGACRNYGNRGGFGATADEQKYGKKHQGHPKLVDFQRSYGFLQRVPLRLRRQFERPYLCCFSQHSSVLRQRLFHYRLCPHRSLLWRLAPPIPQAVVVELLQNEHTPCVRHMISAWRHQMMKTFAN